LFDFGRKTRRVGEFHKSIRKIFSRIGRLVMDDWVSMDLVCSWKWWSELKIDGRVNRMAYYGWYILVGVIRVGAENFLPLRDTHAIK
jgi:hypothetical protein